MYSNPCQSGGNQPGQNLPGAFNPQVGGYNLQGGYITQAAYNPPGVYPSGPSSNRGRPQQQYAGLETWQWFHAVDKDRRRKISARELQIVLKNCQGKNFSDAAINLMIGMFDHDKSGTLDICEFQNLYNYIDQWLGVFKTFDRDQSGFIEEQELNQALTQMGFRFSPQFVNFLITKSDLKHHRQISVDQFIIICVQIQRFSKAFRLRDLERKGFVTVGFEDFLSIALSCST